MRLEKLSPNEGECALLTPGSNFFYLTGMDFVGVHERFFALLITKGDKPVIVAPRLYESGLEGWAGELHLWKDGEDPVRIVRETLKQRNVRALLVEESTPAGMILPFAGAYRLEPLGRRVKELRERKCSEEIERIKRACVIVDRVFEELLSTSFEGRKESDIAKLIDDRISELGGKPSFETIVASGANGAEPHHTVSEKRIERGDLVVMDYGARLGGYCSDITRTVAVKEVKSGAAEVYEIVREAQQSAFECVSESATAESVDMAARDVIAGKGYGENFTHRTGHGLGIDVHEDPYITQGNKERLGDGMVFTIEPGVYLKGALGIRIEDDVAIIGGKGERLTDAERDLMIV
jgi:Xaa-Pro dipeptidase